MLFEAVALVTSWKSEELKGWLLPRGRRDDTDASHADAAARELEEEAGVTGTTPKPLGDPIETESYVWYFYEIEVTHVAETWEQQGIRKRDWYDYDTAMALLEGNKKAETRGPEPLILGF